MMITLHPKHSAPRVSSQESKLLYHKLPKVQNLFQTSVSFKKKACEFGTIRVEQMKNPRLIIPGSDYKDRNCTFAKTAQTLYLSGLFSFMSQMVLHDTAPKRYN